MKKLLGLLDPGTSYPQTWHLVERLPFRWMVRLAQIFCGWFVGHELSETEWSYGGGPYAERNCRWCDKLFEVPKEAIAVSHPESYEMIEHFDEHHQH